MSYNSNLKTWGASGSEFPDNYSYEAGEQPVDEWDNFVTSNVITDIQHLVNKTNDDLVHRTGGLLTGDLDIDTHSLLGSAGSVDFSGSELDIDATTDILQSLKVGGDITVSGTTLWDSTNSHIPQTNLQNDSVTVTAGSGLIGGGTVSLGGSTTLDVDVNKLTSDSEIQSQMRRNF